MKRTNLSITLSLSALLSVTLATAAHAGPVRVADVRQIVNGNPNKQTAAGAAQLVVAVRQDAPLSQTGNQPNGDNAAAPKPQDTPPRVITEEEFEITEDAEPCNCPEPPQVKPFVSTKGGGFPWWLGFGAVPLGFIGCCGDDSSPTPTPSGSTTPVDSPTPAVSPSTIPSITPTAPTPPPEVPEPATILLFGTGLTGIGFAARRLMRRKDGENEE